MNKNRRNMEVAVIENSVCEERWSGLIPARRDVETKKKSFEEAIVECDGRPVSEFFDELRRQVKEYFKNA